MEPQRDAQTEPPTEPASETPMAQLSERALERT